MGILLVGGFIRSFCFTGLNALQFADVDDRHASQATSLNAVSQQLSVASGVAVAGGALEVLSHLHEGELMLADFHIAWIVVALVASGSIFAFMRLPADAGNEVSGHRMRPIPKAAE
jgi:hypothetical protein